MSLELRYVELKSGYADDGPAWIGRVKISRTGATIYFNDHAYRKCRGISGNYIDIETEEEIQDCFPVERIHQLLNDPNSDIPLHQIF